MFMKQCNKGFACGASCISKADECRHGLSGEGSRALDDLVVSRELYNTVRDWYSNQENLDVNTTPEAFAHDAVHAMFKQGVTLEEERLVLNIQNSLTGEGVDPAMQAAVENALASITDFDLLLEVAELTLKVK